MKENNKNAKTEEQTKKAPVKKKEFWDDLQLTSEPDAADPLNSTDGLFFIDDSDDIPEEETVAVGEIIDIDQIDSEQEKANEPQLADDTPTDTVEAANKADEPAETPAAETETKPAAEAETPKEHRPVKEKKKKEKKPKAEKKLKVEKKPKAEKVKKQSAAEADSSSAQQNDAPKEASILSICLPLVIICIAVSLMLAAVNAMTEDKIAHNAALEKQNAVLAIFTDATYASLYGTEGTSEIYLAIRDNELVGFCISVPESGFGGAMSLMIGRDTAGAVCGVEIVSMAETPGIGTKTKSASFLEQFRGSTSFEIGVNMDAISGATISSRAVTRAVNSALSIDLDAQSIAVANGLTVGNAAEKAPTPVIPDIQPPAEDTTAPDTSSETEAETAPVEDTTADTTGEADTLPVVDPIDTSEDTNNVIIASSDTVFVEDLTEPPTEEITTEPETEPETEPDEETTETDTSAEDTTAEDTSADTTGEADTSAEDTTEEDTSADTTGEADTSAEDTTDEDTSVETTGEADTSAEDTTEENTDTDTDTTDEIPVA